MADAHSTPLSFAHAFPPPPKGDAGWPWTFPSTPVAPSLSDGSPWPKISIVVPTANLGRYLEKALRSLLVQQYPALEVVVIDDGSKDDSVEIIKKYAAYLKHWQTGPTQGLAACINEGLKHCTGDVFNWLCGDDFLTENSLFRVAELWNKSKCEILVGACLQVNAMTGEKGQRTPHIPTSLKAFLEPDSNGMSQPAVFLNRQLVVERGGVLPQLKYLFGWELYLRLLTETEKAPRGKETIERLAISLLHPGASKPTYGTQVQKETKEILTIHAQRANAHNKPIFESYLKRLVRDDLITETFTRRQANLGDLLRLASKDPSMWFSSHFWDSCLRLWKRWLTST